MIFLIRNYQLLISDHQLQFPHLILVVALESLQSFSLNSPEAMKRLMSLFIASGLHSSTPNTTPPES
ncbi:hypothetical protein EB796_009412 [Bugula neritina]|uniref:Uncharacterized protein n=1 Tax=Bugula neritina TaxID=10212 RepID=A0A7J7K3Y9_BUGNE|nr:hypothetical protein EB796_009412 [Bugula neritina]